MNKFIKRVLVLGGVVTAGYQGLRIYRLFKSMAELEVSLPDYLETTFGERPKVKCGLEINNKMVVSVSARFSPETLTNHSNIEETISTYIDENYPDVGKRRPFIKVIDNSLSTEEIIRKFYPENAEKIISRIAAAKAAQEKRKQSET